MFIATVAIVIASVRFDNVLDYVAPNKLILYNPGNGPNLYAPGQFTPAAKLAATKQQADALAAQLIVGTVAWLLDGRQPSAVSRQPLE